MMPHRTLCAVLSEIRTCYETRNFSYLPGRVEEAQWMGERMEAALWDQNDCRSARVELDRLRTAVKEHQEECKTLNKEIAERRSTIAVLKRKENNLVSMVTHMRSKSSAG